MALATGISSPSKAGSTAAGAQAVARRKTNTKRETCFMYTLTTILNAAAAGRVPCKLEHVGRTPWSAADPQVGLCGTRASPAAQGVRPQFFRAHNSNPIAPGAAAASTRQWDMAIAIYQA